MVISDFGASKFFWLLPEKENAVYYVVSTHLLMGLL